MDIGSILEKVDKYFAENKGAQAETLLRESIEQAVREQDNNSLLQLLNELLGYYRETSQVEASYAIAGQAAALAEKMGLKGTLPYATTLLNVANAYRAGGRLEESLKCYLQVREIYAGLLSGSDMLTASLENNLSLLYQEMGDFAQAKESLLKALAIAEKKEAEFETAVSCANLAVTCMRLKQEEEAYNYACRAIRDFEKMGVEDAHYGAALSALGSYHYERQEYASAKKNFQIAMEILEKNFGKNEYYYRMQENFRACETADAEQPLQPAGSGLELAKAYYENCCKPMLEKQFPEYVEKIAVGLVGQGSDCFGYDDVFSRDHDWGPDVCLWITDETSAVIGEALKQAYERLPVSFQGFERSTTPMGQGRRGVMTIASFYKSLLNTDCYEEIDWTNVPDSALAAAVNGIVFKDEEGIFTSLRNRLREGYPEKIRFLKIAESGAQFAQTAQYNYERMKKRGDTVTAQMMLSDGMRAAMKLAHYMEGKYPPHDKWLCRSTKQLAEGKELCRMLEKVYRADRNGSENTLELIEGTAAFLCKKLYEKNFISDTEAYLDAHTQELLYKADIAGNTKEELVERIVGLEFEAFDKVKNVGGRAECQNDWTTFSIMRKSQYLTWNRTMLLQYFYDFWREYHSGHNLIEEKYGRMMESTAPEEYERIKGNFPEISSEKKQIVKQITGIQVSWMEEFSEKFPYLADNARSIHAYDDNLYNTSYETYLRGEISTYSDKMLELYGRYIVERAKENRNVVFEIMENSVRLYGYKDLEAAEAFLR